MQCGGFLPRRQDKFLYLEEVGKNTVGPHPQNDNQPDFNLSRPAQFDTWKENFKENKHKDKISKIAQRKISKALDYIIYCAKSKQIPKGYKGEGLSFKISFITLTLCSPQIHSDKEIIHNCLQPLLNWLRKSYNVDSYIWRAEKQKNDNLHFHLILDEFIPYSELRNKWNKYLQNLGYVGRYAEIQRAWHKEGFHVRGKLLKVWSEENQLKAYRKGHTNNWNNPNTVDVHSTKHIHNLKKYLCKYLTKSRNEKINPEEINNKSTIELLPIDSRLWACSERLSNIRGAKDDFDTRYSDEIVKAQNVKGAKTVVKDHYSIIYISVKYLPHIGCNHLAKLFDEYIRIRFP